MGQVLPARTAAQFAGYGGGIAQARLGIAPASLRGTRDHRLSVLL